MIPISETDLLLNVEIIQGTNINMYVNAVGSLSFNQINITAGKYNGFISGPFFLYMGGFYKNFRWTYWRYCYNQGEGSYRSICTKCERKQFLYVEGLCDGNL